MKRDTSYPLLTLVWSLFGLSWLASRKHRRSVRKRTLFGLDGVRGGR